MHAEPERQLAELEHSLPRPRYRALGRALGDLMVTPCLASLFRCALKPHKHELNGRQQGAEARQEQHMYPCQKRTLFYRVLARRLCSLPRPGFGCEVSAQTAQSSPVAEEAEGSSFTDSI